MNIAIIHAGGDGSRMRKGQNKIFIDLAGKSILFHTLKIFEEHKKINQIIITAQEKDFLKIKKIIDEGKFRKVNSIVKAGPTRQESSYLALKELDLNKNKYQLKRKSFKNTFVLIHNAVNPLVTQKEITAAIKAAKKYGASLLAQPAKDTIKHFAKGKVKTLERKELWLAQTPQVVRLDIGFKAFDQAKKQNFISRATDDAAIIEHLGYPVKIVPCSEENFKITYPVDLILAEEILKLREKYV